MNGIISTDLGRIDGPKLTMWRARLRFATGVQQVWPLFVVADDKSTTTDDARNVVRRIIRFAKSGEATLADAIERDVVPFRDYVRAQVAPAIRSGTHRGHVIAVERDCLVIAISEVDLFDRKLSPARRAAAVNKLLRMAAADGMPAQGDVVDPPSSPEAVNDRAKKRPRPRPHVRFKIWIPGLGKDRQVQTACHRTADAVIAELTGTAPRRPKRK